MAYANIRTTSLKMKSLPDTANTFFTWCPLVWCLDLRPKSPWFIQDHLPFFHTFLNLLENDIDTLKPRGWNWFSFIQLEDSQKNSTSQAFPKQRRAFAYHKLTHGLPIVATKQKSSVSYK